MVFSLGGGYPDSVKVQEERVLMMVATMRKPGERREARMQVMPQEIRGLLTQPDKQIQMPFLVWDISESGIGLWTSATLSEGNIVTLTLGQPYLSILECRVIWCSDEGTQGIRMGLEATQESSRQLMALIDELFSNQDDHDSDPLEAYRTV